MRRSTSITSPRLINRSLDEAGRQRVVEMMWEIVYADGHVTEFEDNLLWRAADLLGVSARDRIELRQRVANGRGTDATVSAGEATGHADHRCLRRHRRRAGSRIRRERA